MKNNAFKRYILFAFMLGSTLSAFGQTKWDLFIRNMNYLPSTTKITGLYPEKYMSFNVDSAGNTEVYKTLFFEVYPETGLLKKVTKYDSLTDTYIFQYENFYNQYGLTDSIHLYEFDTLNLLKPTFRLYFHFDSLRSIGKAVIDSAVSKKYLRGEFVEEEKMIRKFDDHDNVTEFSEYLKFNNQWYKRTGYKANYDYNDSGFLENVYYDPWDEDIQEYYRFYHFQMEGFYPDGNYKKMTGYFYTDTGGYNLPDFLFDSIQWVKPNRPFYFTANYEDYPMYYVSRRYQKVYNRYTQQWQFRQLELKEWDTVIWKQTMCKYYNRDVANNTWVFDGFTEYRWNQYVAGLTSFLLCPWDPEQNILDTNSHTLYKFKFDSVGNLIKREYHVLDTAANFYKYVGYFRFYNFRPFNNIKKTPKPLEGINIYPNPANTALFITSKKHLEHVQLEIFTMQGNRVFSKQISQLMAQAEKKISIAHLPAGMYILRIQTDKGFVTKKFTKL